MACPPGGAWGPRSTRECPCPHGPSLDPCIRVGRVKKEGSPQGLLFGPLPPPLPTKPSKWKKCGLYFTSVFQFPLNCVCSPRGLTAWTHRTPFHWSRCPTWAAVPLVGAEDSGVFSPPMPGLHPSLAESLAQVRVKPDFKGNYTILTVLAICRGQPDWAKGCPRSRESITSG